MQSRSYEKLIVWKEAHLLCLKMYRLQQKFPKHELFALGSQIRRCSYSVPMNIVESNAKRSKKEKLHYLEIAETSLDELDYQTLLSKDLGYLSSEELEDVRGHISRVGFLLSKLRSSLSNL